MKESKFEEHRGRHPKFYWIMCLIFPPIIVLPLAEWILEQIHEERAQVIDESLLKHLRP